MVPRICVAAIAALFLAIAPNVGATASGQSSCQGAVTSVQATTGQLQGGSIADDVHTLGQPAFSDFQKGLALQQPCN
jgi:hypothetical protein